MASNPFFESELFNELNDALKHSSRFTATYRIAAGDYAEAKKIARGIAVEQTVECPDELFVNTWIEDTVIGQIEDLKKADPGSYYAIISYSPDTVEGEMTELMNMLFGNTSLQPGIRLMSFELPDSMYRHYPGPKFGRQGIRELCGIEKGPILMSALKPLGRSAKDFGETAYKLALGGCPLIKDDHSLFNQSYAPFKDRVKACVDSVNNANTKTGGRSLYIANCTADSMEFLERAMTAQELGAGGIMAAPGLLGLSIIRELSSAPDFHLPIFLRPSCPQCGFRRFPLLLLRPVQPPGRRRCRHIHQLRRTLSFHRRSMPENLRRYGNRNGRAPLYLPCSQRRHEMAAF